MDVEAPIPLHIILHDPVGQKSFLEFSESEHSEELLMFWISVQKFREHCGTHDIGDQVLTGKELRVARRIFKEYIKPGARLEVTLGCDVQQSLCLIMMGDIDSSVFSFAQEKTFVELNKDQLLRYHGSRFYHDFVGECMTKLLNELHAIRTVHHSSCSGSGIVSVRVGKKQWHNGINGWSFESPEAACPVFLGNPYGSAVVKAWMVKKGMGALIKFLEDIARLKHVAISHPKDIAHAHEHVLKTYVWGDKDTSIAHWCNTMDFKFDRSRISKTDFDELGRAAYAVVLKEFGLFLKSSEFRSCLQRLSRWDAAQRAMKNAKKRVHDRQQQYQAKKRAVKDHKGKRAIAPGASGKIGRVNPFDDPDSSVPMRIIPSATLEEMESCSEMTSSTTPWTPNLRLRVIPAELPEACLERDITPSSATPTTRATPAPADAVDSAQTHDLERHPSQRLPSPHTSYDAAPSMTRRAFERLFEEEEFLGAFIRFCRGEHSEENIMFWLEVERFANVQSKRTLAEARRICTRYLDGANEISSSVSFENPGRAHLHVSISPDERRAIHSTLRLCAAQNKPPPADLFQGAQLESVTAMRIDAFPRFMLTDEYQKLQAMVAEQECAAKKKALSCCTIL